MRCMDSVGSGERNGGRVRRVYDVGSTVGWGWWYVVVCCEMWGVYVCDVVMECVLSKRFIASITLYIINCCGKVCYDKG